MKQQNLSTKITIQDVVQSYKLLESQDPQQRYKANTFLCAISHRDQAWQIAQNMLSNLQDVRFQFLGTQILYQKVSHEINNLSKEAKSQLREFVFSKLSDNAINDGAIIDKLASIGALIGFMSCMPGQGWQSLIQDLVNFMKVSQHNLRSGIYVFQRIPEQLRATNRINMAKRNSIVSRLLEKQKQLSQVFSQILNLNNEKLTKKCMQAMQSWAKSQYNFLKYPQLIKKILLTSLESFQKFQSCTIMIIEAIKGSSNNKQSNSQCISISQWSPEKQISLYSKQQIESIKLLLNYISQNKTNFLTPASQIEPEYVDMFTDIIKQLLLNFTFLIKEQIGFQLLQIVMYFSKSADLRVSQSTFQFWMDFGDKMLKCKIQPEVKNRFAGKIDQLFQIIGSKIVVESQIMLDDPDMKQDVTIDDDINAMSFSEYRKQSVAMFQYFYNFFLNFNGSSKYFFEKCFKFIGNQQNTQLGKGTQLALFCIKSAIQSMISQTDAQYICKLLNFVIKKGTNVYSKICVEALLLIRDCTRQIKHDNNLCMNALTYSLYFLKDQRICYYAAQAFKILMETLTTISDPEIVANMINYYRNEKFPNQQIIDKIIEGIFSTIIKMQDQSLINNYITQLVQIILNKFQQIHTSLNNQNQSTHTKTDKPYQPYLLPLLELKTLLTNFDSTSQQFKLKYHQIHKKILLMGLKMITITIPYCIKQKQKYTRYNQLGISCSIYKLALKLCGNGGHGSSIDNNILQQFLKILDLTFYTLDPNIITETYTIFELLCYTMMNFVTKNLQKLNIWLYQRIKHINNFFMTYLQPINLADVDIIRCYYQIQESLILYNCQIFLEVGCHYDIFDLALYILRHINQSKMQRKIVNFLYVCSQIVQVFFDRYPKIIEIIITSIPIVAGMSHHNLSRMFLFIADKLPNIKQILQSSLKMNPYENISQNMINLLVNLIMLIIKPNSNEITPNMKERRFIMMIKDLNQLAKNGELPNQLLQLQFRYHYWLKNKQQDQ